MNTKAELIVLNHTKFGENTIILHTLSNEYGRRGFLVRAGAKSSMALFLPMNILEAEISENPKSQLWKASNFVCLSPLNGIRGDIRKNTMTVFMSEVLYRAILEDTNEGGLASWLKQEILTLDALKPAGPMFCPRLQPLSSRLSSFRRHPAQQHRSPAAELLPRFPRILFPGRKLPIGLVSGQAFPIFSVSGQAFPIFFVSGRASPIFSVSGQAFPIFFVSGRASPIFSVSGQAFPTFFLA